MSGHVFISHSDKDKTFAHLLLTALEDRKVQCWIAPRDIPPGGSYADAIMRAIEDCSLFVLVYTAHSNNSPHVLREVERALKYGRNIVPVRFDKTEPSRSLDYLLATIQWLSIDASMLRATVNRAADQIVACLPTATSPREVRMSAGQTPAGSAVINAPSRALKFAALGGIITFLAVAMLWWLANRNLRTSGPIASSTVAPSPMVSATIAIQAHAPLQPSVSQAPPQTEATTTAFAAVTQSSPTLSREPLSPGAQNGAEQILRRYFAYFAEREPASAYALLSTNFRSAMSFRKYSLMFASTREINPVEIHSVRLTDSNATLEVRFEEVDVGYHKAYWEGPIDLVRENGDWRIQTLRELKKIQSPPGPKLPEKRWDRPHIFLHLANPNQIKAAQTLKSRLRNMGCDVVEIESVTDNADIPSETSEIRYFTPGDAAEAQRLATELQSFFGTSGVIADLPEGMPYVSHSRQYEIWFSSKYH